MRHLLEQISCLIETEAVAKVLHDTRREVIRDNAGHLYFRFRTKLPALGEECFGSLQETEFSISRRDGLQFPVAL